ncbi:Acetylcholine receptor subunit alpha-like protein [Cyphomyrmex costatus]|uniref:Acetylcholine receptor subunit alpha-like protein n=1 Tax=Cyphomyrmex costatus TaxID=456900 RepID=A0A151K1V1_9HYME|nr:Acetylcholine receptor subunit alpha-like protein [Cyphomyrmex costatus]
MAPWVKRVFIHILPRLLVMRRPQYKFDTSRYTSGRVLMRTVRGREKTCYYPYHTPTQEDSEEHLTPKRFHSRPPSKEDLSPSRYLQQYENTSINELYKDNKYISN